MSILNFFRYLLDLGANVDRCTLRGTALHEAVFGGRPGTTALLVYSGATLTKINPSTGLTPMDVAVRATPPNERIIETLNGL